VDLGEPAVRSWDQIFNAFDPDKVVWLFILLALEFVLGVVLAFNKNEFDWDQVFGIAKKNVIIMIAWGAAFVYSELAGNVVYGLALAYVGGSVVSNITAILGSSIKGTAGQILTRGPGDGGDTSGSTATDLGNIED